MNEGVKILTTDWFKEFVEVRKQKKILKQEIESHGGVIEFAMATFETEDEQRKFMNFYYTEVLKWWK